MPTMVMTGASSGLGEVAAERLLRDRARLIVGSRGGAPSGAEVLPLDLVSLRSVRSFVEATLSRLNGTSIDSLVLNAGIQFADGDRRSEDGYETTFAVNHLAHYLLARLLLPRLAKGAHVVLTTSGTHDPARKTIVPAPRHANAEYLAHPERDPEHDKNPMVAGGRAYASSKLCNILTARGLARLPEVVARDITVVAYDPGATPGTRLVRNGPLLYRVVWNAPLFVVRLVIPQVSTLADAGRALAELASGAERPPENRTYASLRGGKILWPDPSVLARSDEAMKALWRDSASMVGLPS
jgi:NAD(P)-dependent dehydrogenase (short-subunit alcohol dehydrogenase family)